MSSIIHYVSAALKDALAFLLIGAFLVSAQAQEAATAPQKPTPQVSSAQRKVTVDDVGKLLTEKDLKEMQKYAIFLKRKHGFIFHFVSGQLKNRAIDDVLEDFVRYLGVGATPDDKSAIMLVLCNELHPEKKTEFRLRLGNGWNGILAYGHFNYGLEQYVQPVLKEEPVDKEKLSFGIEELYTRMISVAIKNAKAKGIVVEETQPAATAANPATAQTAATAQSATKTQAAAVEQSASKTPGDATAQPVAKQRGDATAPSVAKSDDALAAKVIADATAAAQANNGSDKEDSATGTMRARPLGLKDPGIPPSYSSELPPKPDYKRYVCDWGDLLMPSDRAYIEFLGQKLDRLTTAELVLVTVPTRGQMPIKSFSIKIANDWGIGKKDKNNGCMLLGIKDKLMRQQSGKIRIEVGRYLEGRLNDAKCGRILDDLALPPFLRDNSTKEEQSAGLVSAYEYLAKEIAAEYGQNLGIDVNVYKLPEPPQGVFLVSDSGNVLNGADLATVEKLGKKLQEKTGKRLFFVSMTDLNRQYSLENVALELLDSWKILSSDKRNTMLVLVNSEVLFDVKANRKFYAAAWGANFKEAMTPEKFRTLYKGLLADLKKREKPEDVETQPVDREKVSNAFRDFYICVAQEIAGEGDYKKGAELLELPKGTVSYDDFVTSDFWIYVGLYFLIAVAALFTQPVLGFLMLLWPVVVVMMFFPKGRKWLKDAWNTPGGGSYSGHSSRYDDSYSSSSYSSSSSSSDSYGGGSFGGGGADR